MTESFRGSIYYVTVSSFPFRRLSAGLLACCLVVAVGATTLKLEMPPEEAMEAINAKQLRMHLEFLASKELGGRYTLSPSFQIAARYLATRLESYGYKGAKDGSFFQPFDVKTSRVDPQRSSITITANGTSETRGYGQFFNAGDQGGEVKGEVVFVGYGVSSPQQKQDDYAGIDVRGKIVLVAPGIPDAVDKSQLTEAEQEAKAARRHGALAVVYLPRYYEVQSMERESYRHQSLEIVRLAVDQDRIPVIRVNADVAEKLLRTAGLAYKDVLARQRRGEPLTAKPLAAHLTIALSITAQSETTQNVAGVLAGTDPKLRDEYVVFSAHYDHLRTAPNGQIYPGADDDGSGTSGVLAIAEAMSLRRPKRSVLIIFHAGEELGLLGSKYNSDFAPLIPLTKMVANFNIDMIGRSRPPNDTSEANKQLTTADTIYLIGANRTSRELQQISEQTNKEFAKLTLDYLLNDPTHPDQIFYRSDHWNYGKHGVPFIFYFDGISQDYHQPSDTLEKIDYTKMTRVTRLVYATGWRVANFTRRIRNGTGR